ncbi:helix-turn-helix domain-containing protein [Streptomyces caatingaensis]|uniref:HTH cro/C1-type domain-containing protein n=1 Tax=Streptomyces caatingaensis TaxID=1678637 RepID=A0A0K9X6Z4_9ACTN|nr:helix-turn-helix transcriptional regulator [Streptomyces caatingaensis]KNB49209.1 hypothetical protein AC230_28255 [Streptomyces caatingaensis]
MAEGTEGTEGIAAFAERLRELKERSGHSYGTLAKRLHMSTSTVHRYCSGAAVPTEFAPVERFARLCGADREELVALHRRWIVADDARRRKALPAAGGAAAPTTAATDTTAATPDGTAGTGTTAATTATADAKAAPATTTTTELPPQNTPRLRRALLVAGVAAVVVPGAVLAGCSLERSHGDRARGGSARPQADGAWRTPRPGGPSGTADVPSATPSPATPPGEFPLHDGLFPPSTTPHPPSPGAEPDVPGNPPDSPPGSRNPGRTPDSPTRPSPRPDVPLTATVRMDDLGDERCDTLYVSGRQPGAVAAPPAGDADAGGWRAAMSAVPGGRMRIEVTVQGKERKAVVLHALRVRTVGGRRPPLDWSAYAMGDGCGGGVTPEHFDVDLDRDRPAARPVSGRQGDIVIPARDFPYKASSTDPEVLKVLAHTDAHDVSWYLELDWSSGDRRGTLRIDDHGRPFRTSAVRQRPQYAYRFDTRTWEQLPDYARR